VFRLGPVTVHVATQAGPRIVGYARSDGPQLFASLPGATVAHPGSGEFRFLGGHRLWRSPEVPSITYHPDDTPVRIVEDRDGFTVSGGRDGDGIVRTISVVQRGPYTVVDHQFENLGPARVRTALWAITQLVPGGVAILPERLDPVDETGVLPNRRIVVWPYTDLSGPEIEFTPGAVIVHATSSAAKTKIGLPNSRGWIAYALDGELFVKWSSLNNEHGTYPDHGASAQCYRDERFLELETVGQLVWLDPGDVSVHREVWRLDSLGDTPIGYATASLPSAPEGIVV
jgi:hypothetical protein